MKKNLLKYLLLFSLVFAAHSVFAMESDSQDTNIEEFANTIQESMVKLSKLFHENTESLSSDIFVTTQGEVGTQIAGIEVPTDAIILNAKDMLEDIKKIVTNSDESADQKSMELTEYLNQRFRTILNRPTKPQRNLTRVKRLTMVPAVVILSTWVMFAFTVSTIADISSGSQNVGVPVAFFILFASFISPLLSILDNSGMDFNDKIFEYYKEIGLILEVATLAGIGHATYRYCFSNPTTFPDNFDRLEPNDPRVQSLVESLQSAYNKFAAQIQD